jgi:hypothetical protein
VFGGRKEKHVYIFQKKVILQQIRITWLQKPFTTYSKYVSAILKIRFVINGKICIAMNGANRLNFHALDFKWFTRFGNDDPSVWYLELPRNGNTAFRHNKNTIRLLQQDAGSVLIEMITVRVRHKRNIDFSGYLFRRDGRWCKPRIVFQVQVCGNYQVT